MFRRDGQYRLQPITSIVYPPLLAFIVRFRWLATLLVSLSLIMPHLAGGASLPTLLSPQSAPVEQAVRLAADAESGLAGEAHGSGAERSAESGTESDPYSADYPYEMDKILALFSLHWGTVAVPWGGGYLAGQAPDPVFSFERPPKLRIG